LTSACAGQPAFHAAYSATTRVQRRRSKAVSFGLSAMRKVLLWDHDGVLVDTERWYFSATRDCLSDLGITLDQRTYLELMAAGRSCWELARLDGLPEAQISTARKRRDTLYRKFLEEESIALPGVVDVLRHLQGRYRMAVVSTARREDIDLIHRGRKLLGFFEFVIAFEDCARVKPDPEPYLQALRRLGADARDAIAIEDSARGLQSAVEAGIDCVVVRSDFTAGQDFSRAWKVIASVRELPHAIGDELPAELKPVDGERP
jgi:HAD superfamily hydrolase (TIGR01509 family)